MLYHISYRYVAFEFLLILLFMLPQNAFSGNTTKISGQNIVTKNSSLKECLEIALKNNRRRPASIFAIEIAEAQHRQALAGYWPQLIFQSGFQLEDEGSNFIFPPSTINLPIENDTPITIPGIGTLSLSPIDVPLQDVKLMNKESYYAELGAKWLLYDGGMRKGYREQTHGFVEAMKQESRRTELQIIDSVKRFYYGAVLADLLYLVGNEILEGMEVTLRLTQTMYHEGSGKVNKTNWLDNKVMVETIRSMVALLEKNKLMSRAALANTMGMPWNASVTPKDRELPFTPLNIELEQLVSTAYQFNPDWAKVEAGIQALQGAAKTARSEYFPKFAFVGRLHKWWNDYDYGMATEKNKEGWSVGIGMEIPLFNGFLIKNRVAEARARLSKIKTEKILLKEGIGLQIRAKMLDLRAAEKSYTATYGALLAARENRELNNRAYQHGLVETEKFIQAQLMEALMSAQHYKVCYDHIAIQSQLNVIVGTEIEKILRNEVKQFDHL